MLFAKPGAVNKYERAPWRASKGNNEEDNIDLAEDGVMLVSLFRFYCYY